MKRLILSAFILIACSAVAQKNYTIKIKIPQLKNEECLLSYHFGDKKYVKDTAKFSANGVCTFKSKPNDSLKGGIYLAVFPKLGNKYFEFLVSEKESLIEIETDTNELNKNLKVIVSEENKAFQEDIAFLDSKRTAIENFTKAYTNPKTSEKEKKEIQASMSKIENEIKAYRINFMTSKPNMYWSKILSLMRELDIPEAPRKPNGEMIDSNFQYRYYKSHYWDYTDFNDDRILRTPIFEPKFKNYFEKLVIKNSDSIIQECDYILGKIKNKKSDMWNYCLVTMLNEYANSNVMGLDAVYVHLVEKYYAKGQAPWVDSATLDKMTVNAAELKPLLIGKIASNVKAFDTALVKTWQLYDIKTDYIVLYFWNPDCGHCKKSTPELNDLYDEIKKRNCEVFSVTTANYEELQMWKDFTKEHKLKFINIGDPYFKNLPSFRQIYNIKSTPQVYILDKYYRIIAKRIGVDQIIDFLDNYKKMKGN